MIEAQFVSYQMRVVPEGASEAQLRETQRAFYAGAAAMLAIVHEIGTHPDADELKDVQRLLDVAEELKRFSESVVKGNK